MESTPSIVNWHEVNKIPKPFRQEQSSIQAVAHGADSVQYFQWRKSRGGHEKFHGAVVDHCGHENTRVFREVSHLGSVLNKLDGVVGKGHNGKVAIIYDWQNKWATGFFCGYNNSERDYLAECLKWYKPLWEKGVSVDVIPMDADYSKYDLVIAPFLYMLKDGTIDRIESYVRNGGNFAAGYLTGIVDKDDLCYLGGFPAEKLKDVFGLWCEETDSLPAGFKNTVSYLGKNYEAVNFCDIIHTSSAEVLGTYKTDFYAETPAVTANTYGQGKAYYVAFANDGDFFADFIEKLIKEIGIETSPFITPVGVSVVRRGNFIFVMNFGDEEKIVSLDREYEDVVNGGTLSSVTLPVCGYCILK